MINPKEPPAINLNSDRKFFDPNQVNLVDMVSAKVFIKNFLSKQKWTNMIKCLTHFRKLKCITQKESSK